MAPSSGDSVRVFYLAESRAGLRNDGKRVIQELEDIDPAQTDFIGASQQDCQKWALEQQKLHKFIEQDFITIVDARSIRDSTVLVSRFMPDIGGEPLEFGRYGYLPPEGDIWYDFRIDFERAIDVETDLKFGSIDTVYPVYFGLKEELTDKHGVFDVVKAGRLIEGSDRSVPLY